MDASDTVRLRRSTKNRTQSLAAALYFAARGEGQVRDSPTSEPRSYKSTARVLLNGLGSDELLGGYGRFRTAYKAAGWQAIVDEVSPLVSMLVWRD